MRFYIQVHTTLTASNTHITRHRWAFNPLFSIRWPPPSSRDIQPPTRHVLLSDRELEFMDNGSRPAKRHRMHQARDPTEMAVEGCMKRFRKRGWSVMWVERDEEKLVEAEREREGLEKGHREKGISVCMVLKLINRDETTSVIKTGNVGAYVTSYFIQSCVCVCVERIRLSEYEVPRHPSVINDRQSHTVPGIW